MMKGRKNDKLVRRNGRKKPFVFLWLKASINKAIPRAIPTPGPSGRVIPEIKIKKPQIAKESRLIGFLGGALTVSVETGLNPKE